MRKAYTEKVIDEAKTFFTMTGGTFRRLSDCDGVPVYVGQSVGYKSMVFRFIGTHSDGRNLYSMRHYSNLPQKYMIGGCAL